MITIGQANVWRLDVKRATMRAYYDMLPMCTIPAYNRWLNMKRQVLRATFIAKIEGEEFSRVLC